MFLSKDWIQKQKEAGIGEATFSAYPEIASILAREEERRIQHLYLFRKRVLIAIGIFATLLILNILFAGPLAPVYLTISENAKALEAGYKEWYQARSGFIQFFLPSYLSAWSFPSLFMLSIIIGLITVLYALLPVITYSRSLKGAILAPLIKALATGYSVTREEGIRAAQFYDSGLLPLYNGYASEPSLRLAEGKTVIHLGEIKLFVTAEEKQALGIDTSNRELVFTGIFAAIEMADAPALNGKTILVAKKDNISEERKNYNDLPVLPIGEKPCFVYSSSPEEANFLVTDELMGALASVSKVLSSFVPENVYLDEKIQYFLDRKKRSLTSPVYRNRYITNTVQCSFFENKILITVPAYSPLFGEKSLFRPVHYTYELHLLSALLELVNVVKKSDFAYDKIRMAEKG